VEVVIPEPDEDFVTLLNSGRGDLVGAGLVPDPGLERYVTWTRPTNFVRKVAVISSDSPRSADYKSLAGMKITIPANDPFREDLQDLKKALNIQFFVTTGKPGDQAEDLLALVNQGKIEAAAVNDNIARSALAYLPNLKLGVHLGERRPTGWLVRDNSPELKAALNGFLKKHLKVNPTGRTRRSKMYGTIYDRYFENPLSIQRFQEPAHRPDKSGILSTYDELIRRKAEAIGLDWRMVAALIYQESEFHPEARSKADARGLMQVLPRFAGDQADSLFLPEPNLTAGLRMMKRTYNTYAYLDSLDRWRFTLAEYHAGHGHVTDARRLPEHHPAPPHGTEVFQHDPARILRGRHDGGIRGGNHQPVSDVHAIGGTGSRTEDRSVPRGDSRHEQPGYHRQAGPDHSTGSEVASTQFGNQMTITISGRFDRVWKIVSRSASSCTVRFRLRLMYLPPVLERESPNSNSRSPEFWFRQVFIHSFTAPRSDSSSNPITL